MLRDLNHMYAGDLALNFTLLVSQLALLVVMPPDTGLGDHSGHQVPWRICQTPFSP